MAFKRTAGSILALALFFSCAAHAMSERTVGTQNIRAEKPQYADFRLNDLRGMSTRISDYKGKVVFLNFFATWCPPCRNEMPSMQKLHETMIGKDFVILAVSVDRGGADKVRDFISGNGYTFKVLHDESGYAAKQYSVTSIPATFIIDKEGTIVSRVIGERDWASPHMIAEFNKLAK